MENIETKYKTCCSALSTRNPKLAEIRQALEIKIETLNFHPCRVAIGAYPEPAFQTEKWGLR